MNEPKKIGEALNHENFITNMKVMHERYARAGLSSRRSEDDYLCRPNCQMCGGSGWFRKDIQNIRHPGFGALFPCENVNKAKSRIHNKRSGLIQAEYEWNWTRIIYADTNTKKAVETCSRIVKLGHGLAYLWGTWGNAKTDILKVSTARAIVGGLDATYITMADMLNDIKAGFDDSSSEFRIQKWQDRPVLCLDEFEKHTKSKSGWSDETIQRIMDYRHTNAKRDVSATIIASNKPPSYYDGYLTDRLNDHTVVKMTAPSRRGVNQED